jgi:hypothetical protein
MAGLSQLNELSSIAVPYNVAQRVGTRRMRYYDVFGPSFIFLQQNDQLRHTGHS